MQARLSRAGERVDVAAAMPVHPASFVHLSDLVRGLLHLEHEVLLALPTLVAVDDAWWVQVKHACSDPVEFDARWRRLVDADVDYVRCP